MDDAAALVAERVPPLGGEERVPLAEARGRVLARDLVAGYDLPPFFNSAVDGYAFAHADLAAAPGGADGTARLSLSGARAAAGHQPPPLPRGGAMRVLTGAPMPPGADTVMMQEDARLEGDRAVVLPTGLARGANARPAGEDVARGAVAVPKGRRLGPFEVAMAAAQGLPVLRVTPRPRVGVFSTGDEITPVGRPLGPAKTYDSNRPMLLAMLAALPVEARDLGPLRDRRGETAEALAAAAREHDLLVTTGGVSTGEEDHVRAALEGAGSLVFWRLAVKPGRPAAMGVVGGTPVLGLPGNPVAAAVTFLHLVRPLALRLAGASPEPLPRFPAVADFRAKKKAGRREYLRVSLRREGAALHATRFPREGAGLLSSLTQSDAFAELPEDVVAVAPGDPVAVVPFAGLV